MKNVGIICANGFEEIESITVVDILRRAGIFCQLVGLSNNKYATGSHGVRIAMDQEFSEFKKSNFDAIVLPGGMPGSTTLRESSKLKQLLKKANKEGKIIGAICAAPIALDLPGVLAGKTYTCYPGCEADIASGNHDTADVKVDGNLVTSKGPGTAFLFAYELLTQLGLADKAAELRQSMIYVRD